MDRLDYKSLYMFFKALGNPIRLKILNELTKKEMCVGEVESSVQVSQATVSQHLAVLKEHEIVTCRKEGNMRCYCLRQPELITRILDLAEKTEKEEKK